MDKLLTLYAWFACLLIIVILAMDIVLLFKFKRYYNASGFGIVTCTLLSLVCIQAFAAIIYGATSAIIIQSKGRNKLYINILKDTGIAWLASATLLHTIAITFLRIYSVSYGNKFLKFIKSKTNIALVMMKLWFVSTALSLVTLTSGTTLTYSVFYIGLLVTGIFSVVSFFITIDTSLNTGGRRLVLENGRDLSSNPILPNKRKKEFQVVQNPRKTFTLFSGIVVSFVVFSLPCAVPNLYYTLRGKHITDSVSLIVSLWLLVGVVFNSLWILMRLRSNINDTTGFYAKWTLEKNKRDLIVHYDNTSTGNGYLAKTRSKAHTSLLDDPDGGPDTENETICD